MFIGLPANDGIAKFCKLLVAPKLELVTTLVPFSNTLRNEPFHVMAILQLSDVVSYTVEVEDPNVFHSLCLPEGPAPRKCKESPVVGTVGLLPKNIPVVLSPDITVLFLKFTNQVPPVNEINPFVYIFDKLIESPTRVTWPVVVGI